jgi:8-oxo-dGTP diphosphatase
MTIGGLWYLADVADQCAEQAYHGLHETYTDFLEFDRSHTVSRTRFRTLAERIRDTGAPYGAHTIVYRPSGELLLVRHEGADMWVLPGGGVDPGEEFHEAAARELTEEAGVEGTYEGLAIATRIRVRHGEYDTWGVLPVFAATCRTDPDALSIADPDGEISDARWFEALPKDTRDRADICQWRDRALAV